MTIPDAEMPERFEFSDVGHDGVEFVRFSDYEKLYEAFRLYRELVDKAIEDAKEEL